MKILCINYEYPPLGGGGGVACKGLNKALVQLGCEIDVVTSKMNALSAYEELEGIKIHRVPCIRRHKHYVTTPEMLTFLVPAYLKALELTKKNDYDLNHTHFVVPSGIISYLIWKETGLPYIITSHGSDIPGYNPDRFHLEHNLIKVLWKRIIDNSIALTTPSHFLKQLIQTQIDKPVEVIPNGHDFSENGNGGKRNRILVVTRMFKRKGVQYFIEAVADLKTRWEILIAGDGPYLPELKTAAKNIPLVKFLGFVKNPKLDKLYQSAKIFVFPSIQENFPMVLLEAMRSGCAIITTSSCGCEEVVGDVAVKVTPGSAVEIKTALENLMSDEQEIKRLGELGQQRANIFTWPYVARSFESLFRQYQGKMVPRELTYT